MGKVEMEVVLSENRLDKCCFSQLLPLIYAKYSMFTTYFYQVCKFFFFFLISAKKW